MLMALLGTFLFESPSAPHSSCWYLWPWQARCISFHLTWIHGSTFRDPAGLLMRLKNPGFRTKPFVKTYYLGRLTTKIAISKVNDLNLRLAISMSILWQTVIRQCALERDLELFEAGDATEVGEKGLTLRYAMPYLFRIIEDLFNFNSGGQKVGVVSIIRHVVLNKWYVRRASP